MDKVFVIGDIHGAYRALRQCLEKSHFDYDRDHLISLGDVSDGWPETKQCIDELLRIKRLTYLFGNHDEWTLAWMKTGYIENIWFRQGGEATINSYPEKVPASHIEFLENAKDYYIDKNRLFVHAGIDPFTPIEFQTRDVFLWDRNLARLAIDMASKDVKTRLTTYDEVFIGHTPISSSVPVLCNEVWLMDTGAGWSGVLSMMDIESKECFISDPVPELYPGITGRQRTK